MRVFVTGASGFVGNAVARAFREAGHQVMGLVRSEEKAKALLALEIEPILGDMETPSSYVKAAEWAEVMVQCAQERSQHGVVRDAATIDTFISIAKSGIASRAILYTSGCWIYGDTQGKVADEASPCKPPELVKWRIRHEEKVLKAAGGPVRTVVIRPGCVYGASGSLTSLWFESTKEGMVEIVGDGSNRWSTVHLHDMARGYVLAAERELSGVVINLTDNVGATVGEMAEAVAKAAGIPGQVKSLSAAEGKEKYGLMVEGLLMDQQVSSERAARLLGWHHRHSGFIAEIDRYYLAWLHSS